MHGSLDVKTCTSLLSKWLQVFHSNHSLGLIWWVACWIWR